MFPDQEGKDILKLVELMLKKPEDLGPGELSAIREGIRGPVTLERVALRLVDGLSDPEWRVRERAAASFHEIVEPLALPRSQALAQKVLWATVGRLAEEEEFGVYKTLLGILVTFAQAFTRMGNPELAGKIREAFEAQIFSNFFRFPMVFLCGLFFPIEKLPALLRPLSYALPLTYGADVLHEAIRGAGRLPLALDFVVLAAFCALLFAVSLRNIKRKWIV
jgi:hypothetical protein